MMTVSTNSHFLSNLLVQITGLVANVSNYPRLCHLLSAIRLVFLLVFARLAALRSLHQKKKLGVCQHLPVGNSINLKVCARSSVG